MVEVSHKPEKNQCGGCDQPRADLYPGPSFLTPNPRSHTNPTLTPLSPLFLLRYPVVFSILVIPLSVVRWIQFSQDSRGGSHMPSGATLSVETIFNLSGFVDVVV